MNFKEYLNTDSSLTESTNDLERIKQLVSKAEYALKTGNKRAYEAWLLAIWNSNDTSKMSKHISAAQALEK